MKATTEIDLTAIVEGLTDHERIRLIELLVGSLDTVGSVAKVRAIINSPSYDD